MIALLRGIVVEKDIQHIVLDVAGVGYTVHVGPDEVATIQTDREYTLYIAENIKEDAYDLYGFTQRSKRALYLQLVSVNGVGPKAAMAILAVAGEHDVRKAIAEGNTSLLSRANGVGKKVAERIVVDLKNKVGLIESADATSFLSEESVQPNDDAMLALMALGYSVQDAKAALSRIDPDLPTEQRIKQALAGK